MASRGDFTEKDYKLAYAMIKPPQSLNLMLVEFITHDIIDELKGFGNFVGRKHVVFEREVAKQLYAEHVGKDFYDALLHSVADQKVTLLYFKRENNSDLIGRMVDVLGNTIPAKTPERIRGRYGFADMEEAKKHLDDYVRGELSLHELKNRFSLLTKDSRELAGTSRTIHTGIHRPDKLPALNREMILIGGRYAPDILITHGGYDSGDLRVS